MRLARYLDRGTLLPRWLAILLGLRRMSPAPGDRLPTLADVYAPEHPDTGGGFRPSFRQQDPAKDPKEPYGGESSSRGSDHGWNRRVHAFVRGDGARLARAGHEHHG